ncbi:hypothetical protein QAD02_018373 [Eretmocerus hayati]|uniref:Uncharacterized protein n=1 Tax=Eretmocerus hayati TaxID=131215 RepID=A0ACC2PGK2_9HYME|nr:hypothetical protein QAD02_018373 [Eretmocerus hayati]
MFAEIVNLSRITLLILFSCMKESQTSQHADSNVGISSNKSWTVPEAEVYYYYPQKFLSEDGLLIYAGCSVVKFPSEMTCNITAISFDLTRSKSCSVKLHPNPTEELKNTAIELHRLGVSRALLSWWTIQESSNRNAIPPPASRQIAIVHFNDCSISRNTIAMQNKRPSYLIPFQNSYEILYSENDYYVSRKKYNFQHKEMEKSDNFLAVDSYDHETDTGGELAMQTVIVPNSNYKISSAWQKRYLIVEGTPNAAKISYASEGGSKIPVAVVKRFYEDRFSTRYGMLTICEEVVQDRSAKIQCLQYDSDKSELKMNVSLNRLNSIEDLVVVRNSIEGGFLHLKNSGGHTYSEYKLVKVHLNATEEVLIEKISINCDISSPMSNVEISSFENDICVYSSCASLIDTEQNHGKASQFQVSRTCRATS